MSWLSLRNRDTVEALSVYRPCILHIFSLSPNPLSYSNPNPNPRFIQIIYCCHWRKTWRLIIIIISSLTIYLRDAPLSDQRLLLLNGSKNGNSSNSLLFLNSCPLYNYISFFSLLCILGFSIRSQKTRFLLFFLFTEFVFSFLIAFCLVSLKNWVRCFVFGTWVDELSNPNNLIDSASVVSGCLKMWWQLVEGVLFSNG